jgi:hypothetical protein
MGSLGRLANRIIEPLGYRVTRQPKTPSEEQRRSCSDSLERLERAVHELTAVGSPVRLQVGCGPRILKGWLNIDLAFEPYGEYMRYYTETHYPPRLRGSASEFFSIDVTRQALPLADSSVDVIWHEDFIEHLDQKGQVLFLAESLRVLKKSGIHRINTPNLVASPPRHDFAQGYTGVRQAEWDKHGHMSILTPRELEELALWVGYSCVEFNGKNASTSDLIPLEYRPDPKDAPEDANVFADLKK